MSEHCAGFFRGVIFPETPFRVKRFIFFVPCLGLLVSATLAVQIPEPKIPLSKLPPASGVDQVTVEWQAVVADAASAGLALTRLQPASENTTRQKSDSFLLTADKAKAFREKYAGRPEAKAAELLEAKSRLNSALFDNQPQDALTATIVADIRTDFGIPAKDRLETVALSEVVRLQPMIRDRAEFLKATETSTRNLISEFPSEVGGYEALFRLAESQSDSAKGTALASELIDMQAPASVKDSARLFLDRQGLVGQLLPKLAEAALGPGNLISASQGKPIVLYTWASWNPGSVAFGKRLAGIVPSGAALIGVNLDKDVATATALAQSESLPGVQLYDARGMDGPLAATLKLSTTLHVFVANIRGEIREVSAQRGDFALKFASALR